MKKILLCILLFVAVGRKRLLKKRQVVLEEELQNLFVYDLDIFLIKTESLFSKADKSFV